MKFITYAGRTKLSQMKAQALQKWKRQPTLTWTLSIKPKTMADVPVVNIPVLNNTFGPMVFK